MKMGEVDLNRIPVKALNVSSRVLLSKLLNPHMEIATSNHLCRDYRGLAEVIGYDNMDIRNIERSSDPTKKILEEWEINSSNTIGGLIGLLTAIERYDVIDDAHASFERDAQSYLNRQLRRQEPPLQVAEISSNRMELMVYENSNILTVDDISLRCGSEQIDCGVTYYDAYVCYAEEDCQFVEQLSEYLESPQIGIKLCLKDRDMVAGIENIYEALVRLIEERCERVLIILSPEFLQSVECKFLAKYAAGLAVAQRNRKLIPLVYKPCDIPQLLRFVSKVDFTKADVHEWIWKKLVISIKGVPSNNIALPSSSFCSAIFTQIPSIEFSSYPLMLETPTRSRSRSVSPQPHVSFPPSVINSAPSVINSASSQVSILANQSSLSAPSTSSQSSRGSSPVSRSKWLPRFAKFGLSLSSNSNHSSGNASSGFHSLTGEQIATSGEVFEERV